MKTTKTYLSGCTWCGATGFVDNPNFGANTASMKTIPCPVCGGGKTVMVTETTEDSEEPARVIIDNK